MRKTIMIFLLLYLGLSAQVSIKESKDIVNLLTGHYSSVKAWQGRFIQRIGSKVYKGDVYYKSPDKFRLDYKTPRSEVMLDDNYRTILSDGETLTTYLPTMHVVSKQALGEKIGFPSSGKGILRLKSEYYFDFYGQREPEKLSMFRSSDLPGATEGDSTVDTYLLGDERSAYHMYLRPKKRSVDKSGFRGIHLWIDESGMIIRSLGMSTTHEIVEFVFRDIESDVDIADKTFEFDTPAGVQILNNNFVPEK